MPSVAAQGRAAPRSIAALLFLAPLFAAAFCGFCALGTWQVHRLAWKLDLIHRVDQRLGAPPVPAPSRSQWPAVNAADDEYRKVCLEGVYLDGPPTLVQAVTRLGPGDWVLAPLRQAGGDIVLVNRGFITPEQRGHIAQPDGEVKTCGLLRISEPRGAFLRHNDPVAGHWYSRDVAAIAAARQLPAAQVAPYFVDADGSANADGAPVGGVTVVQFHNSHLIYACTWYGLALLVAVGAGIAGRHEWRQRHKLSAR